MKASMVKAIREHYSLAEDTKRLIAAANWDLSYGPLSVEDAEAEDLGPYPGFSKACATIARDAEVEDLWIQDDTGCVVANEPVWCDGCDECEDAGHEHPEEWTHVASRDVRRALLGELAAYL